MTKAVEPTPEILKLPLGVLAELARREAVAEAIEEHARASRPLNIWRDGRVVAISAEEACELSARAH